MSYTFLPTVTNTSSKSSPWAPAQPALNSALGGALNAYNTTYNGPLVAGMDPNVTAGQNQQLGIAGQGMTSGAAQTGIGGVQNMLASGGIGAPMQYGIDTLKSTVNNLNPLASGQYLQGNPYLDSIINTTNQNTMNDVNAQFSKAGRYGSGAYAGTLGQKLAQNEGGLRYQDFMNQLNTMLSANNAIGGAANSVAGIGQQGISNVMNGGAALQNYQNPLYADANAQKAVGGERMDYEQAKIDAANQAPWTKVGNLAQIAQGIGSLGGQSKSTSTSIGPVQNQPQMSTGQMMLGGALGGLGLLGNIATGGGFKGLFGSPGSLLGSPFPASYGGR